MDYDCGRDYEYDQALAKMEKKKKIDKDEVIGHLQIIHTWASFARERDMNFFNEKHMISIEEWTEDALELLQKDGEMDDNRDEVIKGLESTREFICATKSMFETGFPNIVTDVYDNALNAILEALELLKEQPEVVRCRDCKWWDKKSGQDNRGYCHASKHGHRSEHWEIGIYRLYTSDWFCADGERR